MNGYMVVAALLILLSLAGWVSVALSPRPGSDEEDTDQLGE